MPPAIPLMSIHAGAGQQQPRSPDQLLPHAPAPVIPVTPPKVCFTLFSLRYNFIGAPYLLVLAFVELASVQEFAQIPQPQIGELDSAPILAAAVLQSVALGEFHSNSFRAS